MTPSAESPGERVMSESALRKKHVADEKAANARLVDAMRQAGVDVFILGTGESHFDVYAERSRLFAVLTLQAPDAKATRRLQRALAWEGFQAARL